MVAPKKINRTVVRVAIVHSPSEGSSRLRARDMVPGADPYIASLIRNLQDEVREERIANSIGLIPNSASAPSSNPLRNEAEVVWEKRQSGFDKPDFDRWAHTRPSYDRPWKDR